MSTTYRLVDPDFRREPPKGLPYCAHCQRSIVEPARSKRVSIDWDTWTVTLDNAGEEWIGPECWKLIESTAMQPSGETNG